MYSAVRHLVWPPEKDTVLESIIIPINVQKIPIVLQQGDFLHKILPQKKVDGSWKFRQ